MRLLVTGRDRLPRLAATTLLRERGHEVVALARPGAGARGARAGARRRRARRRRPARRAASSRAATRSCTSPACPTPRARAPTRPARCARTPARRSTCSRAAPSTARCSSTPRPRAGATPPDPYAISKRLGEEACRLHPARSDRRPPRRRSSGPARCAGRARPGRSPRSPPARSTARPITIPGNPARTRDFLYVDDLVDGLERLVALKGPSGTSPSVRRAAGSTRRCSRPRGWSSRPPASTSPIELPGGELPPGENDSHTPASAGAATRVGRPAAARSGRLVCRLAPPPSRCSRPRPSLTRSPSGSRAGRGPGMELALLPPARRRRRRARRARSAPSPTASRTAGRCSPSRRSRGRAASTCASTGSTTRRARGSSAARGSPRRSARRSSRSTSTSRRRPRSSARRAASTRTPSRRSSTTSPRRARATASRR